MPIIVSSVVKKISFNDEELVDILRKAGFTIGKEAKVTFKNKYQTRRIDNYSVIMITWKESK